MQLGDWTYSIEHQQLCHVIDIQELWGETLYLIWLPVQDVLVRVRADSLMPLNEAAVLSPASLTYLATAARIADALTQDVLLAPLGTSVMPLPHQIGALARAVAGDRVRYLLADEVGLGKTIEAGLIMRELKDRKSVV